MYILPQKKGFAPQAPKNDENDEKMARMAYVTNAGTLLPKTLFVHPEIQLVLTLLVFWSGCCSRPGSASDCAPELACASWPLGHVLGSAAPLPYHLCKHGTYSTSFRNTSEHTPIFLANVSQLLAKFPRCLAKLSRF